jgi:site-specific DNA-methyltransferase (adenine-specific)
MIDLYKGDCLEVMKNIPDGSVDAIICDPPYGTTACKWDSIIPFEPMWEQLNRIIKPNGAIVLFGSQPFTSALIMSNIKNYKYDWIWEKSMPSGMAQSCYMPMKYHETISLFVNKGKPTFNKQLAERNKSSLNRAKYKIRGSGHLSNHIAIGEQLPTQYNPTKVNPKTIIKIKSVPNTPKGSKLHPTQKPIALMEYLIKTYTNENETVLDFTIGSGSTGVACVNTKRNFIGIEKDDKYFEIAKQRIKDQQRKNEEELFRNL